MEDTQTIKYKKSNSLLKKTRHFKEKQGEKWWKNSNNSIHENWNRENTENTTWGNARNRMVKWARTTDASIMNRMQGMP